MIQQASLDIRHDNHDEFIVTPANQAAYALFSQYHYQPAIIFISGVAASGKSLLAQQWVNDQSRLITPNNRQDIIALANHANTAIAIDDVDQCDFLDDEVLFHFYNIVDKQQIPVLMTALSTHADLLHKITLPDWRTRFASILSAHIDDSDEQLLLALMARKCREHYIVPNMNLLHYLITHYPRQYKTMLAMMDNLINHANSRQQKLTIPLAKDILLQHQ